MSIFVSVHILSAPHSAFSHSSPSSLLPLLAATEYQEREALQCRHSNNLSPSDQLVWAMMWVADPAASHNERLTHQAVEVGLPERLAKRIRGAEWQWNKDVGKIEGKREKDGQNEEDRCTDVNKTESCGRGKTPSFPLQSLASLSPITAILLTHQLAQIHQLAQLPSFQGPSEQSPAQPGGVLLGHICLATGSGHGGWRKGNRDHAVAA